MDRDSDDGDGACSLPDGSALMLADEVQIATVAQGRREESDRSKPRSPKPNERGPRAAGTGAHPSATPAKGSEYKSEASETSGEGSEYQAATQHKPQDPVKLLRKQEDEELEAKNDTALGAIYGVGLPQVAKIKGGQPPTTWINILGNDPNEDGFDKCAKLPRVTAVVEAAAAAHRPMFFHRNTIHAPNPLPELKVSVQAACQVGAQTHHRGT
jgi:hypothetical protein